MNSIRIALSSLAVATLLVTHGHAQTPSSSDSGAAASWQADLAARPDGWRYKFHNGHWWYYHPDETWSVWDGSSWLRYTSGAATSPAVLPDELDYEPQAGNVVRRSNSLLPASGGQTPVVPWLGPIANGMSMSATDALPGRANLQMAGGGMGANGGQVLSGRNGGLPNIGGGMINRRDVVSGPLSDVDAVPGRLNPQMAGGGIGVYGSSVGLSSAGEPGLRSGGSFAADALPGQRNPQMSGGGLGINGAAPGQ